MNLCIAQTRPFKGAIQRNIEAHKALIERALEHGASLIIFPELSITGYEPALAARLATTPDDSRFNVFQTLSDANNLTIGVGMPLKNTTGICIGMILFQPHKQRSVYSKKYLHADEEPFFVSGQNAFTTIGEKPVVALAICYELSVPTHAEAAVRNGAQVYLASVAKTASGMEKAGKQASEIAKNYLLPVLLANCIGECDGALGGGKTAVWNRNGLLLKQLTDAREGLLIFDTETENVVEAFL